MTKPFFEVFHTLKLNGGLHDKMEQTQVERVSSTKRKDSLHIYLLSKSLIAKEDIWKVEREIKNQLFPNHFMSITIHERFELSSQYTPENLMRLYEESILEELKQYSHIEYNALRTADITYPDFGKMLLTLHDTVLNRSKEYELIRILEKIVVERCGINCKIEVAYKEAGGEKYAQDNELKIRMKVKEICSRVKLSEEDGMGVTPAAAAAGGGQTEAAAAAEPKNDVSKNQRNTKSAQASFGKKSEYKKGEFKPRTNGGDYTRTLKQSDNPDVIYGKDFEEEAMHIEDIIGEIGEVIIRGKILKLDTREIRNEKTIVMMDVTDFTDTIGAMSM